MLRTTRTRFTAALGGANFAVHTSAAIRCAKSVSQWTEQYQPKKYTTSIRGPCAQTLSWSGATSKPCAAFVTGEKPGGNNVPAGRPHKPIELLKRDGGYRPYRHDKISHSVASTTGLPPKPRGMAKAASKCWDHIIDTRKDWISDSDGLTLQHMCEIWSLRGEAVKRLKEDPHNKDARCALRDWSQIFMQVAGRFGLTPSDRAKLGEEIADAKDNAADFIR